MRRETLLFKMSPLFASVVVLAAVALTTNGVSANNEKLHCNLRTANISKEWVTMVDPCVKAMRDQINTELTASMTYLAMAAHFSTDSVNRPGFAAHFFKSADEEREHAIKLIEYMLMRGELTKDIGELIRNPVPVETAWTSGVAALKHALELETSVTNSIRSIVAVCEDPSSAKEPKDSSNEPKDPKDSKKSSDFNDYHLVDYLTGEFLDEQYKGQRELAGMISTLDKMMRSHGAIGEFLYDKKLMG
ncbi:ferritin subunit [Frankliniella occidentalis]|uniref:Ferritin n=1 Tax=Frankliniella occidentalis TaxID=133901 RepID=A0A6J1SSY8_FRAOC|nr:ferritin subunit [Frankliniella occidentalis]